MAPCGGDSVYGASARSCVVLEDPLIWPQRLPPGAATPRCLPVEGWAASAARASLARARATSSLSTASLPTTRPMTRCRNATWAPAMNPYSPALAPTITKSRVTASKLFTRMRRARGDGQHVVVGVPRKRGPRHNHEALSRNSVDRLLGVLLDAVAGEVAQGDVANGPVAVGERGHIDRLAPEEGLEGLGEELGDGKHGAASLRTTEIELGF